jgi:hypothetical protein
LAVPVPTFFTVTVQEVPVLEKTTEVIVRSGQLTVMFAVGEVALPLFLVVREALLLTVPQVAVVVGLTTWTENPFAMCDMKHLRTPDEIAQALGGAELMLQLVPLFVGSVSVTRTPEAGDFERLVTLIV